MAKLAPQPLDLLEFQFKLRCCLKVFNNDDSSQFNKPCSLLAAASNFGLIFVGNAAPSLQVIQTRTIEEIKEKESDYLCRTIPLPSRPQFLSINCDHTKLCVVVEKDSCANALIYDVVSFAKEGTVLNQVIRLSPTPGVYVTETSWNPTLPNILTVCKSDGSLGLYNLKDSGFEINELPAMAGATCMCWSPKGKQIAVGSRDGRITQYKPDLKAVKAINAPPLEGSQTIIAVQWISNYQFIGVYHDPNVEGANILVVDAPKTGEPSFTNYEDICYSNGATRPVQFFIIFQPSWNVLLVASSNSMEVGVMGVVNEQWTQWILIDAARAELPLLGKRKETFPVGLALDTAATRPLQWAETTLPSAPFLYMLSDHGVLCCFDVINTRNGATSICSPPKQLQDTSGLKYFSKNAIQSDSATNILPSTLTKTAVTTPVQQSEVIVSSASAAMPKLKLDYVVPAQNTLSQTQVLLSKPIAFTAPETSPGSRKILSAKSPQKVTVATTQIIQVQPTKSQQLFKWQAPVTFTASSSTPLISSDTTSQSILANQPVVSHPVVVNQPVAIQSVVNQPFTIQPIMNQPVAIQPVVSQPVGIQPIVLKENKENEYEIALLQQMRKDCIVLETELQAVLHKASSLKINLGADSEIVQMKNDTESLINFLKDVTETTTSQSAEIYSLKQSVVHTWAFYEEARSRFTSSQDPQLSVLLKAQPLDPASERQLLDIRHLMYYIESQLTQVNRALDEEWDNFQDYCKKTYKLQIPSMEVIFQSMVRQGAIMQKQLYLLKDISNRIKRSNRNSASTPLLLSMDNVCSLEKELKNLHIQPQDFSQVLYDNVLKREKQMTLKKVDKLRSLLQNRKLGHVSVHKPNLSSVIMQPKEVEDTILGARVSPVIKDKNSVVRSLNFIQSTPKASFAAQKTVPKSEFNKLTFVVTSSVPATNLSKPFGEIQTSAVVGKTQGITLSKPSTDSSAFVATYQMPSLNLLGATKAVSDGNTFVQTESTVKSIPPASTTVFTAKTVAPSFNSGMSFSFAATTNSIPLASKPSVGLFQALGSTESKVSNVGVSVASNIFTNITNLTSKNNANASFLFTTQPNIIKASVPSSSTTTSTPAGSLFTVVSTTPSLLFGSKVSVSVQSSLAQGTELPKTLFQSVDSLAQSTESPKTLFQSIPAAAATKSPISITKAFTFISPTPQTSVFSNLNKKSDENATTINAETKLTTVMITKVGSTTVTSLNVTNVATTSVTPTPLFGVPIVSSKAFSETVMAKTTSQASLFKDVAATVLTATSVAPSTNIISSSAPSSTSLTFGAVTSAPGSLFGAVVSITSVPSTTTSSLFGNTVPATTAQGSIFASSSLTTTTTDSIFTNVVPSTTVQGSIFGSSATVTTSTSATSGSIFANVVPSTTVQGRIFGSSASITTSTSATSGSIFANVVPSTIVQGSIFGAAPTPISTSAQSSIFSGPAPTTSGTPIQGSIFGGTTTSAPITTSSVFGSTAASKSIFADALTSTAQPSQPINLSTTAPVFSGTTSTSVFGGTTSAPVFAGTTSAPAFGGTTSAVGFGGTTTSTTAFGGTSAAKGTSLFGQPSVFGSAFGAATTTTVPAFSSSAAPAFGSTPSVFGSTPTTTAPFGTFGGASPSSGSVFGQPAAFANSAFGKTTSSSIFGSTPSTTTSAFGSGTSPFASAASSFSPFNTASTSANVFGSPATSQASAFSFASAAGDTPSTNTFGFPPATTSFGFGATNTPKEQASFGFGGLNVGSAAPTSSSEFGSAFGQTQPQNPFGRSSGAEPKPVFGSGSLFSAPVSTSSSIFGSGTGSTFGGAAQTFGSSNAFGAQPVFGQKPAFGQGSFTSSGNVFGGGASPQPGPFSGGNQSVSQTGFGAAPSFQQKPTGFGGSPVFGGQPSPTGGFGSPPSFGGAPTFGSSPTFGASKVFGGTAAPSTFGTATQQQGTFGNLASQNTLGFGNLAQQTQAPTTQSSPFGGGSSFSSWR